MALITTIEGTGMAVFTPKASCRIHYETKPTYRTKPTYSQL